MPDILYALTHESFDLILPPYQRNLGWKERKRKLLHERYGYLQSQANMALDMLLDGADDVPILAALGIDLRQISKKSYTFSEGHKRIRRRFACLKPNK
jgi:hypothetical protein